MGNIIVIAVLIVLFGGIIYSMVKSYKTKGTTCTSCTACRIVQTCDKDTVTNELQALYKSNV